MESNNESLSVAKLLNSKTCIENVTPHKIAVVAYIREFGFLKVEAKSTADCLVAPKYRRDFCILALKLIQCPDLDFKELELLLTNGQYNILSVHLQNFCICLQNIYVNGVSALMDCVTSTIDKLMMENGMITRSSVLGLYLRRIMLQLDKYTFVQSVSLYRLFCLYYQKGRPGLMMRSISKEKLVNKDMPSQSVHPTSPQDEIKNLELPIKLPIIDRDNAFEEGQWSRKQAELFTAQQANLLQINESRAMPPKQLQKTIAEIIKDIPEYSDIHFLSFLNCIRIKEFCGAQDSLYNCFDRSMLNATGNGQSGSDRNKHFRYAALNRTALHTHFGHRSVAMESVLEAQSMCLECGDGAALSTAGVWAGRGRAGRGVGGAPRAAAAALAAHLAAQHRAVNAHAPHKVLQIVTKGDSINYLHSMTDLTLASLVNTAALWALYGKTEMASIYCQLLLNLNTKCSVYGSLDASHWSESCALAAAGVASLVSARGGSLPTVVRDARPLHRENYRGDAVAALHAGKWEEAEQSIQQLASLDRWESQLLKGELYFLKCDPDLALESLRDILDYCKNEEDSLHFMSLRLRALLLASQIQQSFGGIHSMNHSNIVMLNEVVAQAKKYHLHYIAATAEMHIANIQLHFGCAESALALVRKVLPLIMAHGGSYDLARALLLYTKCKVATAPSSSEERTQVLKSCCNILDDVKNNFAKIGNQGRLLETWYLQAQLHHEIGNHAARNQCAWMYRQLETQYPVDNSLLMLY